VLSFGNVLELLKEVKLSSLLTCWRLRFVAVVILWLKRLVLRDCREQARNTDDSYCSSDVIHRAKVCQSTLEAQGEERGNF